MPESNRGFFKLGRLFVCMSQDLVGTRLSWLFKGIGQRGGRIEDLIISIACPRKSQQPQKPLVSIGSDGCARINISLFLSWKRNERRLEEKYGKAVNVSAAAKDRFDCPSSEVPW